MNTYEGKIKSFMCHADVMLREIKKLPPKMQSDELLAALNGMMHCYEGMGKELETRDMMCQRMTHQVNEFSLLLNTAAPRLAIEPSKN